MYNPEPDDNYNEWIELYNPTNISINVSNWSITDNFSEDLIFGDTENGDGTTVIPPKSYAIISDLGTKIYENFSISNNTIKLCVDDFSIGNGLGNNQDKLILKNNKGARIDAIEWGTDYPDVPGLPAIVVDENHSLARYNNTDYNDSSIDFFEAILVTPGWENKLILTNHMEIEIYPRYISKIQNNSDYSIPIAFKINLINFSNSQNLQIKSYVIGNISSIFPSTQSWYNNKWYYSYYYRNITPDENGNWSDWFYLRFNADYQEYQKNIRNNSSAYLVLKIRSENISKELYKKIYLLDLDETTKNGTTGGYSVGVAKKNNTLLYNKIVIIKNFIDTITGIYITEDNEIDENLISSPGYYKIPSPQANNYKIYFMEKNQTIIHTISNITILQGDYNVKIDSINKSFQLKRNETKNITINIKNTGDFTDTYQIKIDSINNKWQARLNKTKISLRPNETSKINLYIKPYFDSESRNTDIVIYATSNSDIGVSDKILFSVELLGSDLTITNCTCYDPLGQKNNRFGEGEIIKIKANAKNIGNLNATDVNISFYYDLLKKDKLIGSKYYDSIANYQKYPSVEWDTQGLTYGDHKIIVVADDQDKNEEFNESNNNYEMQIEIYPTILQDDPKNILITEVYYHTNPNIKNEFIAIYNPTENKIDISEWYITNKICKISQDNTRIIFPKDTFISPKQTLYVTQNATAFKRETGQLPDFEYLTDSRIDINQMNKDKNLTLSNKGSSISLKDQYNHTIDIIAYGEIDYNFTGWNGPPIKKSGTAVILKRNFNFGIPIDTNSSIDWISNRTYGIGQSDFSYIAINCKNSEIKTFVSPDCSYKTIVDEIKNATDSIYFNIYEFTNPFLGDELILALKRHVSVFIFLEGGPIGNIDDREKLILKRIVNNGGNVRFIVNDPKNNVYDRYRFDHAKYLIIDNKTVIVESCNWVKTGIPIDPTFGNREWGIIIRNKDIASYFLDVFLSDWNPDICDSYSYEDMDFSIPSDFSLSETIFTGSYKPKFIPKSIFGNFTAIPVFSPDTSYQAIIDMINLANNSIYIQQLYIYRDWKDSINPFVEKLINKSKQNIDIKIILNYNPSFKPTNEKQNQTKKYLEQYGIEVKFFYTNWSYFTNIHNKGMIVDNESILISSINWNENSVTKNREAGIIITNEDVASFYTKVFFYDWNLSQSIKTDKKIESVDYKNPSLIVIIYGMTFTLVVRDWRKRRWT